MVNSCSAYGCKNRNSKGSTITFHRFPLNNKSLLKLWLYQIKRGGWEPSKYSVICSEHFTEDCFIMKGAGSGRRTLKSDAYPTIFSMAIYSEPPKRTFPGRKSKDAAAEDEKKEEDEEMKEVEDEAEKPEVKSDEEMKEAKDEAEKSEEKSNEEMKEAENEASKSTAESNDVGGSVKEDSREKEPEKEMKNGEAEEQESKEEIKDENVPEAIGSQSSEE